MSSTAFYNSQNLVGIGAVGIGVTNPGTPLDISTTFASVGLTNSSTLWLTALTNLSGATSGGSYTGSYYHSGDNGTQSLLIYAGGTYPNGAGIIQSKDTLLVRNYGQRLLLNPDGGNVGIGTTNPGAPLAVYATTGQNTDIVSFADSVYGSFNFSLNTLSGAYNNLTAAGDALLWVSKLGGANTGCMTIAPWSSGTLGIRIASPTNTLQFGANTYSFVSNSSGTAMMTILGNGSVGIGTASPLRTLHVYGGATNTGPVVFDCAVSSGFTDTAFLVRVAQASATAYAFATFQANSGSDMRCFIRGDGNLYNTNAVYGAISDRNLKENIVPSRSYMDDLNKLQVVKFSFKAEESPVPTQLGLIAQDVAEVFPGLVDTDKDGNKNLKYSILNMMMLKTVQELSATVQTQQTAISSLEQSLGSLEARLAALEAK